MAISTTINIGKQFSRFPVGRYVEDGNSNGQRFREEILTPALVKSDQVVIELDDALGYGSSFLEEAFGGLIRVGRSKDELRIKIKFETSDESLRQEILKYIADADQVR